MLIMMTHHVQYVSKDVTIRVYFSKPKNVSTSKQKFGKLWSKRLRRRIWPCHRRGASHRRPGFDLR